MIYMDNAATSLQKPLQVEQAVLEALRTAGNPGRGAHEATLHASRLVYGARAAAAELFDAEDASRIAFTANATEALNIAISGLIRPGDHVITTVCEHNSVLRPLYRLRDQGSMLSFVGVDARGNLKYEELEAFLRSETRAVVITGASNVTGNVTDLSYISSFVKRNGLLLIVDASQTAGEELFSVQKLGIDVLCFTGHKALLGPQGTGGLYVKPGLSVEPLLVGGSGIHSYDEHHPKEMPTALEAGTLNVHGLAGLAAGHPLPDGSGDREIAETGAGFNTPFLRTGEGNSGHHCVWSSGGKMSCADRLPQPCRGRFGTCGGCTLGRIRHLRPRGGTLCAAHAPGAWNGRSGSGAVQFFAF